MGGIEAGGFQTLLQQNRPNSNRVNDNRPIKGGLKPIRDVVKLGERSPGTNEIIEGPLIRNHVVTSEADGESNRCL